MAGTLRGLNLQQAEALLAATQRRSYAHQVGESGRRFSSDWQQSLQDAARDPAYMAHNHGRIGRSALIALSSSIRETQQEALTSLRPGLCLAIFSARCCAVNFGWLCPGCMSPPRLLSEKRIRAAMISTVHVLCLRGCTSPEGMLIAVSTLLHLSAGVSTLVIFLE